MNLYRVAVVAGVASGIGLGGEHKLPVLVEGAGFKLLLCLTSAVGLERLHRTNGQAERTPLAAFRGHEPEPRAVAHSL